MDLNKHSVFGKGTQRVFRNPIRINTRYTLNKDSFSFCYTINNVVIFNNAVVPKTR